MDNDGRLVADALLALRDYPIRFNRLVLNRPSYWYRQEEIARALVRYKNVVVATGNAVGKSYLAAGLVCWWLYTRPRSQVVVTAPSQTLLGTVLFKEIRAAIHSSKLGIPLTGRITTSPQVSPQILEIGPGWGAIGIATRGVERLSGQHNPQLLQVVDEASGVLPDIWEALNSQNPQKRVIFGNPLSAGTEFHRLWLRGQREAADPSIPDSQKTVSIKIPSTDSPDIHLERSSRGLADRGFLREAERDWGKDTPLWLSHVLAEFPRETAYSLIPFDWIDRCFSVVLPTKRYGFNRLAIDLSAGVGADRTVLVVGDDVGIRHLESSSFMGLAGAATHAAELCRRFQIRSEHVTYDASGIGRDLPDQLRLHGITSAIPYVGSASGASRNGMAFANLRSGSAWKIRSRFDPSYRKPQSFDLDREAEIEELQRCDVPWLRGVDLGSKPGEPEPPYSMPLDVVGLHHESLREELGALRYKPGLRIGLESKDELTKKLGRSPDLADALLMLFSLGD